MSIVSMSLGSTAARLSAISDEAPQSMRQRKPPDSMRMQVCRRPPLPNASPLPKNRIRTSAISFGSPAGSRGDTLDDRQQETRWYHAVQGETRLKIEIPELILSALPAPAAHQHPHVGGQDRNVLPRVRPCRRNECMDGKQSTV